MKARRVSPRRGDAGCLRTRKSAAQSLGALPPTQIDLFAKQARPRVGPSRRPIRSPREAICRETRVPKSFRRICFAKRFPREML